MSSVKLKHASGNGAILHAPAANPSNDVTLKVPSTTGSAGQFLRTASSNHSATNAELEWATPTDTTTPADNTVGAGKTDLDIVAGDIIYGTGTNAWARLAKGSDDQVLTLASGLPSWAAGGGGAITRIISDTDSTEFEMLNSNDPYRLGGTSGFELSFTPPSVNTSYLLLFKICMHRDSDDGQWGLEVKSSTDNWSSYHHTFGFMHPSYGAESDVKERGVFMAMKEYKPGTTSALKIGVWGQIWSGDALDITFNGHSGSSMMVAFELDDNKKVGDWG
jgi:hypothetical protein